MINILRQRHVRVIWILLDERQRGVVQLIMQIEQRLATRADLRVDHVGLIEYLDLRDTQEESVGPVELPAEWSGE